MEAGSTLQADKTASFESLALDSLNPGLTDKIFLQNSSLFVEICSRWIQTGAESEAKIAAFGHILPLAPFLGDHAEWFLESVSQSSIFRSQALVPSRTPVHPLSEIRLCHLLLGIFRLLSFDCRSFAKYVRPLALESLFHNPSLSVRYLAVRTFCLYAHTADDATQQMINRVVGGREVQGEWEGRTVDYRFLSLWEEKRWKELHSRLVRNRATGTKYIPLGGYRDLSSSTVQIGAILLPRLDGAPSREMSMDLIPTSTTKSNLENIAQALLSSRPLLLTGLAGSGKTLLTRHFAWQLNKLESMVTLHLNEQSDAKLLIGMYATGTKPGTFSWRPGVLTTAVKEGRWIFIEDLDRAPNEVISTLLPLIERGELLIPSRGETIRAARGFRIIATMRTTVNPRGQEIVPRQNMIGYRFWNTITVHIPTLSELEQIVSIKYPELQKHVGGMMRVYSRLLQLYSDAQFSSENGTSLRALTPRDLLKWCDRTASLLDKASVFSTAQMDDIFMEAFDCFAGSLGSHQSRARVMACVAEELHIDPQKRDHLIRNREVKLEMPSKSTSSGTIRIGRVQLSRHRSLKRHASGRPFSTNDYTLRLLEKVAVAVDRKEPLLLVGETGTGKTTCIQYLAEHLGRKLVAFNLSQQSESGDLLGGYKPVNVRSLVVPLKDEFDDLFDATFSRKKNQRFIEMLGKRVAKGEWKRVCMLWREALKMVDVARKAHESQASSPDPDGGQPKKRRKVESLPAKFPDARWEKFAAGLHDFEAQLASGTEAFAFSFLEGNIVKAVRNGDWVLLDEINLASSDTLEALADLLGGGPDGTPSLLLTETGNVERIVAHPDFRVFAAMNPATDVGKKDLPPGIRSRFTELYVESPDRDPKSLQSIVEKYLGGQSVDPSLVRVATDVTKLYLRIQELAKANMLVDGADQKAHFSLRTLTRTLSYAREIAPLCTLRRALYEGFHMSFLTFLGKASEDLVAPLIKEHLYPQKAVMKAELGKPLLQPSDGRTYVRQGHYWLRQGAFAVEEQPHYIITPFVQRNMDNLIRATSTRRYPVLIQGPTSSGKTSMIEYLAKRSGNKFVRINNHEHTDLQEYLGSYISGTDGKLVFQEGILVRALREGHWIVLDELNLAPTDVLEALNRLLDDNRELLIPETQEVVRPHEDFMLFATQNPAGLYGGRKVLSRAFRNRFLELHFDDIPVDELTEILHRRTMIPESWCKRIVGVYQELSTLRQENRIFEQKSFATLRDLFRWAQRKADTVQDLATNGYMLLAERVRKEEERIAVKNIVESVMSKKGPRVVVDEDKLYSEDFSPEITLYKQRSDKNGGVVWTRAMRRLFVLVARALRNNEPVLLVGETGCGKTTVCQMLADAFASELHILNAHQNTETGDLIGAQRPIRNRAAVEDVLKRQLKTVLGMLPGNNDTSTFELPQLLDWYDNLDHTTRNTISSTHHEEIQATRVKSTALFEWADGILVHAMKAGQFFLLDEISLADDSVLERLNSVLESSRTLLLAEKGPVDSLVTANEGFQFLATMNPGGDYGKKELSPALRNRFTEIWVPALSNVDDILQIVGSKLKPNAVQYANSIVDFAQWFNEKYNTSVTSSISIRDTLAWVTFINSCANHDAIFGIVHGAAMVFIDTLGANPAGLLAVSPASLDTERKACLNRLSELLGSDISGLYFDTIKVIVGTESLQLGAFTVPIISRTVSADLDFSFDAPTTRSNGMRVIRALQLPKPILLEGNPGVGKTTLIMALSKTIGKPLTRLNLSEQTDLMDLFGSDVPVEGGQAGTFSWCDAPFLKAMKNGDWVLLDEMNLASQSVLEGLNAVLDHRGEVYISELDQTFYKHPEFRVFAAQNPHHQGGGRKGLPASFVNRFTVVYTDVFRPEDLLLICAKVFPGVKEDEIVRLISFVTQLENEVVERRTFGALGAPWEFNLRDTLRWLQLLASQAYSGSARDFLDTIFGQRFRSEPDRQCLKALFESFYGAHEPRMTLYHSLSTQALQTGLGLLSRDVALTRPELVANMRVSQLPYFEALMISVRQNWPVILVGPPGSGKTSIINQLASLVGAKILTFSMNADIDAMDLVGGYEQLDSSRSRQRFLSELDELVRRKLALSDDHSADLLRLLEFVSDANLSTADLSPLLEPLTTIAQGSTGELDLLQELHHLLQLPQQIDGARFQWVDGILINALQHGNWLVLDNANLCNSAVLDRLNSLLEPNGYLSINEHSTADGEARVIKPHPNFRVFMTMDPRFGELSRAMRNRAVEICILPKDDDAEAGFRGLPEYPLDSQVSRFRPLCIKDEVSWNVLANLENLSILDTDGLRSFVRQASQGLITLEGSDSLAIVNGVPADRTDPDGAAKLRNTTAVNLNHYVEFLVRSWHAQSESLQRRVRSEEHGVSLPILPYHPLNNELCLHRSGPLMATSKWYASMYDILLDLCDMRRAIQSLPSFKFERTKEKQKLPAFLYAFLQNAEKSIDTALSIGPTEGNSQPDNFFPKGLRQLFWAFHGLATGSQFERATFQAYLKMLSAAISPVDEVSGTLSTPLMQGLLKNAAELRSNVQLTTGFGMERIWLHFKPDTPRTWKQLSAIEALEALADRLDVTMWKTNLKFEQMLQIRERFASSLELLRTKGAEADELIKSLEVAVSELEDSISGHEIVMTPYLEDEFEGLCQFLDVTYESSCQNNPNNTSSPASNSMITAKVSLLARRPTKLLRSGDVQHPSESFVRMHRHVGLEKQPSQEMVLRECFHTATLCKLQHADEVPLAQLDRFEFELQVFSQHLVLESKRIALFHSHGLSHIFRSIYSGLCASHGIDDISRFPEHPLGQHQGVEIPDSYRNALATVSQCSTQVGSLNTMDSRAWMTLGLTGLLLYVPNYPHDPALQPIIARDLFNKEKAGLQSKLGALQSFQLSFTGQETSFRIRQMEAAIQRMGDEPPIPDIVRPDTSNLDALQGEFTNLLSTIQPLVSGSLTAQEACQDDTLRQNLVRVIRRLEEGYRGYDDITAPAVGFLLCLHIGLILTEREGNQQDHVSRSLAYIGRHSPFFGLHTCNDAPDSKSLVWEFEAQFERPQTAVNLRWHILHCLVIIKSVDPSFFLENTSRELIHNLFSSFYSEWKTKLLQDQKEESKNTSLYTYRGQEEDDDDEDRGLFPDYETEDGAPQETSTSREHAINLSNIHAKIICGAPAAPDAMKALIRWCVSETTRVAGGEGHGTKLENALPAIYITLESKWDALLSPGQGKSYNFYFDANLSEAKRLITLVHTIQSRYRQILRVWPEHATLSDVLRTCNEALEFRHVDPLAKLITKVEKLHAYMYEWQRVASRNFSTSELYDDLTKLLVSWRQLELTTWARLFDNELERSRNEAKSWFFIAYETVIVAAESIADDTASEMHTKDLLKSLEGFFLTTTLGQYEQRISLLRQLHEHVASRTVDAVFNHVRIGLENFISYFSRLQKPIQEALSKGRQALEKEVKNVIKLASWKDTNIEALKQSAKTSHRKLTKLVRKFRALLNQPVSGIMSSGFHEEIVAVEDVRMHDVVTNVPSSALELCAAHIPRWKDRPLRFKNLDITVPMMSRISTPNVDKIDGAAYIESFIADLETSMIQLQKATPKTLTEENKSLVQHLKARKRKLYADTMKCLRQMGVKANLSSDVLARQDQLSTVLANLPAITSGNAGHGRKAEYYLHRYLSIMHQVRDLAKEHSGDLTSNDVARSIGYLEGLLHVTIRQRKVLNKAARDLTDLEVPTSMIASLCALPDEGIATICDGQAYAADTMRPRLSWLCAMLQTGADIVAAQAKLGQTNEIRDLIEGMRMWAAKLKTLAGSLDELPTLPRNIWSHAHSKLHLAIKDELSNFGETFKLWMTQFPVSRIVLEHILPYVFGYPDSIEDETHKAKDITTEMYSQTIFAALDFMLGSMQDIETALKDLPTSVDDTAWLAKEEQTVSAAISALHSTQIRQVVQDCLETMRCFRDPDSLTGIVALYKALRPIFDQYMASHRFLVDRFDSLHCATAKLLYRLSKSFIQVGTQGFCQPPEKSADEQPSKDEKLESGTGLGEGEGAEDISKDIQDDEDLDELAQEKGGEREGSIEEEEDAVDMGEQEMEGETSEVAEKEDKGSDTEEGDEDAQSEVGSVDDLGPSAVDEKMWDEGGKEDDSKEKEGNQDVGTADKDEQVASEQKDQSGDNGEQDDKQNDQEDEDLEMEGEDQEENVGVGETEQMDPYAKEEETLDLPDELNMDGEDGKEDEDGGDMDMSDDLGEEMDAEPGAEPDSLEDEVGADSDNQQKDTADHVEEPDAEQQEDGEEPMDEDAVPLPDQNVPEDEPSDLHKNQQADSNMDAGSGADANEEAHKDQHEQVSAGAANQEEGMEGETSEQKQETAAEDGLLGKIAQLDASSRGEQSDESPETQSFRKLGDVLERWYDQQKKISEAQNKDETQMQQIDKEVDMANADFEHLPDEETEADTQALGTATEEQARALDHDMAMAVDEDETLPTRPDEKNEEMPANQEDVDMEEANSHEERDQRQPPTDSRPQTFIGEQKPLGPEDTAMEDAKSMDDDRSDSSVDEVETQLELTHLESPAATAIAPDSARALWLAHESSTHSLSQQLTEQLRLILAPTLATKLGGDYRTGKRLNLKRIIPYIASGYKRDKIWLRRSTLSKRSYQVMIALDDSRSMAESGAAELALKTLTLVTRSLSMLEVGEVAVVGFGEGINVAHEFDKPFTSESGVRVFEQFGFAASKTNVRGLVNRGLDLFADARRKGGSSAGEDLWQLMLIVSDGICDDHVEIQRLVRQAQEERVMIVFIIIDSLSPPVSSQPASSKGSSAASTSAQREKTSIMDLQSVEISGEGKVVRWKYMERFPFRYYLVVRDVRELPGVLSGALRQWFGEVAGTA